MNDTPTAAPMREDVTHEMALFEQHFRLSDLSKYCDGQVVAGRVRYAETNVDKMFTAWLASVNAHTVRPNTKDVVGEQGNHDCLAKRAPDEPYLVLLARDPDAPTMADTWADRRAAAGGDPIHCAQVRAIAQAMRDWRCGPTGFPSNSAPEPSAYKRAAGGDGYATAFYEIATMLGIGAQAASPADVWSEQMRPKLEALTARTDAAGTVDRTLLAKLLNEAAGPRRIAGEDDAPLFADSKPEVQEYWLEIADAAIAAVAGEGGTMADLRQVQDAVATLLTDIGMHFKGSPKITLLVRHPDFEAEGKDADFVMTDDTLNQAIAALQRQAAAAEKPAKGFSRFDPPGLWESEPRSSADDAGEVGR